MKVHYPVAGVIHFSFRTQWEVTHAMARIQEYYESPFPKLRGQVFSRATFEASYEDVNRDYYRKWHGFNVPGDVVRDFFAKVGDLDADEHAIRNILYPLLVSNEALFYIIATHEDDPDSDVLDHELAHAMYYLDMSYRAVMDRRLDSLHMILPSLANRLDDWLVKRGYCSAVIRDEEQAYIATTSADWWREHDMSPGDAQLLAELGRVFAEGLKYTLERRNRECPNMATG